MIVVSAKLVFVNAVRGLGRGDLRRSPKTPLCHDSINLHFSWSVVVYKPKGQPDGHTGTYYSSPLTSNDALKSTR